LRYSPSIWRKGKTRGSETWPYEILADDAPFAFNAMARDAGNGLENVILW
jgi:hypothetical protein